MDLKCVPCAQEAVAKARPVDRRAAVHNDARRAHLVMGGESVCIDHFMQRSGYLPEEYRA